MSAARTMIQPSEASSGTGPRGRLRTFINRDLSELAFVQRVLEQAEDESNPLLERARFLAITGMLLDEFYRIRVAALREQIRQRSKFRSLDGKKPSAQLKQADKLSNRLTRRQDRCWQSLQAELRKSGIDVLTVRQIPQSALGALRHAFHSQIRPVLHPVPATREALQDSVQDGELLLLAELGGLVEPPSCTEVFVDVPSELPRFIPLSDTSVRFVPIEVVIKLFFEELLEGQSVKSVALARVLREGSLKRYRDGDDLLTLVKDAIARREHADVIRLRVERSMPARMTYSLSEKLGLLDHLQIKALERSRRKATKSEFVISNAFLGVSDLMQLVDLLPPELAAPLSYPKVEPNYPSCIVECGGDHFAAIAARDRMLHFPYDDFEVLIALVRQAATDAAVVSISQTLYRAGEDSPIIEALTEAARNGKRVSVVIEIEAREDEQRNIELAALLERAGATVSYGPLDRKVHAKLLLIERLENGRVRCYAHYSTGNYSISSGRSYTDLCLLSTDRRLFDDAKQVFDFAQKGDPPGELRKLAVAPLCLRERIESLIQRETENALAGKPAAIWMKLNKLSDRRIIELLYAACAAGVEIDIIVRGVCCLRAGIPGLSERIRVQSVVGRLLEHSRAVCFGNGSLLPSDSAEVFISSADLMPDKLDERVEILVPVENVELCRRIQHEVFLPYFGDSASSWDLNTDDEWIRRVPTGANVHEQLFTLQSDFR